MIRTRIQLTEEQAFKVRQIASSRGVPMAEVIRDAVEAASGWRELIGSE